MFQKQRRKSPLDDAKTETILVRVKSTRQAATVGTLLQAGSRDWRFNITASSTLVSSQIKAASLHQGLALLLRSGCIQVLPKTNRLDLTIMSSNVPSTEKHTIGASFQPIDSRHASDLNLPAQQAPLQPDAHHNNPSATSLPTPTPNTEVEHENYDPTSIDPFSPFYSHARASESRSRLHTRSSTVQDPIDLEKGRHTGVTISTVLSHGSAVPRDDNYNLPSREQRPRCQNKQSLLCRSEAKNAQGWWRNLSKRQRVLVHVLIALVFIGAVTGLGIGVSKAMGTGIWKTESASQPIGEET
ncbi:MAG: hypothetical protein Q9169_005910 [Polycauliona sp. 2 TL-2023]